MDSGQATTQPFGPQQLGVPVLARILSASADAIVIIDKNRRYLYANPPAGEIAGVPHQDLIGRDFMDNIAPRMHETIQTGFQKSLTGFPGRRSSVVVRPDGEEREIEYSTMSLHHNGEPLVASIFHDVTHQRQQEREASARVQIASSLTINQPLEDKLRALATHIIQATRAIASSVMLVDEQSLELKTVGTAGFPEGALDALFSTWSAATSSDSMVVRAYREQQSHVIENARALNLSNPRYAHAHDLIRSLPWDTIVASPIVYRGDALGADACRHRPAAGNRAGRIRAVTGHQTNPEIAGRQVADRAQAIIRARETGLGRE